MADLFNLERFVTAQDPVLARVRQELQSGRKSSHWMWFVFPQLAGLGHSTTARHYAVSSMAEAQAYLRHRILGPRLIECSELVNGIQDRSVHQIFGSPDDLKFHSSMTLFALAQPEEKIFQAVLSRYFHGGMDQATVNGLK